MSTILNNHEGQTVVLETISVHTLIKLEAIIVPIIGLTGSSVWLKDNDYNPDNGSCELKKIKTILMQMKISKVKEQKVTMS